MSRHVILTLVLALCFVTLAACQKHDFAVGERVRRKYNHDISGVIVRRTNYDGKGDVYYIKLSGKPWEYNEDGPNRADELERIP
jgi:hypothetical protein